MMRIECFCLSLLLLAAGIVPAGSQTDPARSRAETAYLAARDTAIAKIRQRDARETATDADLARDARDLRDLASRLRPIIGRVAIAGFGTDGAPNIETLSNGDVGFGALDALVFRGKASTDATLYVTTGALFARWLKEHEHWWEAKPLPQSPDEALEREAVYTQAISADASIQLYGRLPVMPPAGSGLALSYLEAATQDEAPARPDHLLAAVMHDDRLFIFLVPLATAFKPIPACKARHDDTAAARRCFAAHSPAQPAFAAATRQAQHLIDLAASKR